MQAAKVQTFTAVEELKRLAIENAERFVRSHRSAIGAVAASLIKEGRLDGEAIRRLVSAHS